MNRLALSTLSLATAIIVITLGYATPAFSAKPGACDPPQDPPHPSCNSGDDTDGAMFNVLIAGDALAGGSGDNPWLESFGGKNAIGLNDAAPAGFDIGTLTGLGSFTGQPGACFPSDFVDPHSSAFQLHQAIIKSGKKGRAEASFWFHGATDDGSVRVLYVLKLFGDFVGDVEFPGNAILSMSDWELKVENEGRKIKNMSCAGQGTNKNVTITVVEEPVP